MIGEWYGHFTCAEGRVPLVRLSGRIQTIDDDLQSVQPVVAARFLAEVAQCPGRCRGRDTHHGNRQHLHQGAAFGGKGGRSDQAIAHSRGGFRTELAFRRVARELSEHLSQAKLYAEPFRS